MHDYVDSSYHPCAMCVFISSLQSSCFVPISFTQIPICVLFPSALPIVTMDIRLTNMAAKSVSVKVWYCMAYYMTILSISFSLNLLSFSYIWDSIFLLLWLWMMVSKFQAFWKTKFQFFFKMFIHTKIGIGNTPVTGHIHTGYRLFYTCKK